MFIIDMHGLRDFVDRIEEFAHAGRAISRLLHREPHEVEVGGLHVGGARRRRPCGSSRIPRATCSCRPFTGMRVEAFGIDEVGPAGRQTRVDLVAAEHEPRGETSYRRRRRGRRMYEVDMSSRLAQIRMKGQGVRPKWRRQRGARMSAGPRLRRTA